MPINPNIALGAQQQQPVNMLGQMGQAMALKAASQEIEGGEGVRGLLKDGAPEDPTALLQYGKQGRATYESLLRGRKEQLESTVKKIGITSSAFKVIEDNPTLETAQKVFGDLVGMGAMDKRAAADAFAKVTANPTPENIRSLARQGIEYGITAAERLTAQTRIQAANISAGPSYGQLALAREKDARDVAQQEELAKLMRAPQTNALATAAAPTSDPYERINNLDTRIEQLMSTGNPKAIPIAQALNAQRTQLLASAKNQYGGGLVDMQVPDPADPSKTITIKGRTDQYGRVVPAEIGAPPLSVDASATGGTTISPSVVRAAPTAGQERMAETARVKEEGQKTVNTVLGTLNRQYQGLVNEGGITDTSKSTLANLKASASSNVAGQMIGSAVGSKAQQFRDSVAQTRPLLLNAIKNASGMSAQQLNSNVELQTYLKAATDPGLSIQANVEAMNNISKLFGLGEEFKIEPPAKKGSSASPSTGGVALPKGFKLD
jgi:hypothetical protein